MHERISPTTGFFILATSAIHQLIGFFAGWVPFLGTVWEWVGYIAFLVWFAILGVNMLSGKNALKKGGVMGVGAIVDSIPFLNVIPAQLLSVWYVIHVTRKEDKEKARAAAQKAAAQAANDNHPSSGGMRRAA